MKAHQVYRLQSLLSFIDENLAQRISLETLAESSCWSRWQLQRVFQLAYGESLMGYVRKQRLSRAAQKLLRSDAGINTIAIDTGFESQAVFSRVFKDHFLCSPRVYRQRGEAIGLFPQYLPPVLRCQKDFHVEIKAKPSFQLQGMHSQFNSAISNNANNEKVLYDLWNSLRTSCRKKNIVPDSFYGLTDVSTAINEDLDGITYWAGYVTEYPPASDGFECILVPAQNYAVFTHTGKLSSLRDTLLQFLLEWIPQSQYRCVSGYEIERHLLDQAKVDSDDFSIEFWIPVELNESR